MNCAMCGFCVGLFLSFSSFLSFTYLFIHSFIVEEESPVAQAVLEFSELM